MNLLQQLDSIFSVANGLLFVLVSLIVVCIYVLVQERKDVEVVLATTSSPVFEAEPEQDWAQAEADAYYDGNVVNVVGYCMCKVGETMFKECYFTTNKESADDNEFLNMVACSHCDVCNPEGLVDVVEDDVSVLHVVSCELLRDNGNDYIVRFNDGTYSEVTWDATCDMYEPMNKFGIIQDITVAQANALELYTGKTVIPF